MQPQILAKAWGLAELSAIRVFYRLEGEDLYISMYFLEWVGIGKFVLNIL